MLKAFFDEPAENKSIKSPGNKNYSAFFRNCAEALSAVVKKHGKVKSRYSIAAWAAEFSEINRVDGIPRSRISDALDFYLAAFGKPYIPAAYSASGFRRKFLQIEAAAKRGIREPQPDPGKIQITDTARGIQRACGYLIWPGKKETDAELAFIQISFDRYSAFEQAAASAQAKAAAKAEIEETRQLAETGCVKSTVWEHARTLHFIWMTLPDPVEYITEWTRLIHRRACEWSKWDGDLIRHAWHPGVKPFVLERRDALREQNNEPDSWEQIFSEISAEIRIDRR